VDDSRSVFLIVGSFELLGGAALLIWRRPFVAVLWTIVPEERRVRLPAWYPRFLRWLVAFIGTALFVLGAFFVYVWLADATG
jgi:hypothetical protein